MKKLYNFKLLAIAILTLFSIDTFSQYTTKRVRDVHKEYTDSLKNVKYDYVFPILGQGAYSEGFDIPYPMGIMANYFWTDQGILINNLQLGYKNAYNLDNSFDLRPIVDENGNEILGFGESRNTSYSFNVRPDLWVFPFLNVYGIFGYGQSHTEVIINKLGNHDFNMKSVVDQGISTSGFGFLVAGGIGPVWLTADLNFTWNKPENLDKPTFVNVVGLRMGKAFTSKKRPDKNFALWVGAMWIKMQSETVGEIQMKDALPKETWDNKDQIVSDYNDWYDNEATPFQKIVADKTLGPIIDELDKRNGESIVQYGIDKQVAKNWNMLLGAQYQFNKHWQLRFEAGILGDRTSFLASLNYRFLGIKKKSKK